MRTASEKVYVVTRQYLSSKSNGLCSADCKVFRESEMAINTMVEWREEELALRKETGCAYTIHIDSEEEFYCIWDNEEETLSIHYHETGINP